MTDKQLFENLATTTLNGALDATQTTVTVVDGSVFPAPLAPSGGLQSEYTLVTIEAEILKITAVSGNDLTVVRAQEGTTGATHADTLDVDARATADTFAAAVMMDNDGDRKGADSVNLQSVRATTTMVASGNSAIVVGANSTASGDHSVAVGNYASALAAVAVALGYSASASDGANIAIGSSASAGASGGIAIGSDADADDLTGATSWTAITEVPTGDINAVDANWAYALVGWVDTGAAEPTGTALGDIVTDGSVVWYFFEDSATNNNSIVSIGANCVTYGGDTVAIGIGVSAYGNGNLAIGYGSTIIGQDNILLGTNTFSFGRNNTIIGAHGRTYSIEDREVTNATLIGDAVDFAVSYTCRIVGPDYIPLEDGTFDAGTTADSYKTTSAKEQIFYSAPIQAGVKIWATATSYKHGETVTPTTPVGYSYFARVTGSNGHYGSATSGGGEPSWPTTAGATVADGSITWVCVKLDAIACYLPDNTRLLPTEVGFIADEHSGAPTVQPYFSFGIATDTDLWATSAITTRLTAAYARESITTLLTTAVGSKTLGADVVTPGTVNSASGRVYWKGILVETMTA